MVEAPADAAANGAAEEPTAEPEAAAAAAEAQAGASAMVAKESEETAGEARRWPGWPGDSVYRLVVPVLKVGSIIGRKGELIKRLCDETGARVRVLDGPLGNRDRIVLISGREEPEAQISPAMDAVLRVFKRVVGIPESEADATPGSTTSAMCSIRLLVASSQGFSLIGKQGASIKPIQESSGAMIQVLGGDELPFYATTDEKIVEIHGEPMKVLKALEAVVGHLRKFLVHHSVLPLFEKSFKTPVAQEHLIDAWGDETQSSVHTVPQTGIRDDYSLPLKQDSFYIDLESQLDPHLQHSRVSLYEQDLAFSEFHSSGLGRTSGALVTQASQTIQVPLSYAEEIIGVGGETIAYIRRNSGAILALQESRIMPDEIIIEIKGTSTQVQIAQQLIQDVIAGWKDTVARSNRSLDTGRRLGYSWYDSTDYPSSSLTAESYGGYRSSGLGGYRSYRF